MILFSNFTPSIIPCSCISLSLTCKLNTCVLFDYLSDSGCVCVTSVKSIHRCQLSVNYRTGTCTTAWMLYHYSFKLSLIKQVASKLAAFFKAIGVEYVFDTTFSKDLALIERYNRIQYKYYCWVYALCEFTYTVERNL